MDFEANVMQIRKICCMPGEYILLYIITIILVILYVHCKVDIYHTHLVAVTIHDSKDGLLRLTANFFAMPRFPMIGFGLGPGMPCTLKY